MNEQIIWDFLLGKLDNPFGVAAIMGNLMAESSLNPKCATGTKNTSYIKDADDGNIDFINDGVAFGLVQWCYRTRKEGLLNYAKRYGTSVGNLDTQLNYLWQELQSYKTAFNAVKNATDIKAASDTFMLKYEKPANTSEAAKKKRADYGQSFYNKYASNIKVKTVTATANVNIRSGNGKEYSKLGLLTKNKSLPYVATSDNGWYAVQLSGCVGWISSEFAKI